MPRLKSPTTTIRKLELGADHPIRIQSMTNTDTSDAKATAEQCIELAKAGSELVRLTVNNEQSAAAIPEIRKIIDDKGFEDLPLIGDFHFNGHELLAKHPLCAKTLDKYRINPGNVGYGDQHDENFATILKIALDNDKPVRIGVNWGSIDRALLTSMMDKNSKILSPKDARDVMIDTMVESAIQSAAFAEKIGLERNKIILSAKMSVVQDVIEAYQKLATRMKKENRYYGLHLGLTEAGSELQGTVASAAALAILLQEGLGDTIRVSLTPTKDQPRTQEVEVCKHLLQSLGFRYFKPKVTSCPGCGRTDSHFFQELAAEVSEHITIKMNEWKVKYPGVEKLKIAVMGCVVNGPGESSHSDIAISLPGNNEQKMAPVFIDGKLTKTLQGENIPTQFIEILDNYVNTKYKR